MLFVHSFPGLHAWNLSLLKNSFIRFNGCFVRSPSPERPNKASVYNAYGRPHVLSNVTEKCSRTCVSSLLTATFALASLFSLLQAPVVYSCVAGVEEGRGIGGREKGRGVGKRVPFPFCDFLPLPFLSLLRRLQLFKRQDLLSYGQI